MRPRRRPALGSSNYLLPLCNSRAVPGLGGSVAITRTARCVDVWLYFTVAAQEDILAPSVPLGEQRANFLCLSCVAMSLCVDDCS